MSYVTDADRARRYWWLLQLLHEEKWGDLPSGLQSLRDKNDESKYAHWQELDRLIASAVEADQ